MIETYTENQKENMVFDMIRAIGENPNRVGLKGTPTRIVKMWKELFRGYDESQKPNITVFPNGQDGVTYDQMIIDEGSFYSHCEHHIIPFFGKYWFAYIPNKKGRILGISKIARVVDYYAARLQVQERLVQNIVDELWDALLFDEGADGCTAPYPLGMALVMKGKHLCKSMRGVKKEGNMTTIEMRGAFRKNPEVRAEFLKFVNGN